MVGWDRNVHVIPFTTMTEELRHHQVIDRPWEWEVVAFTYSRLDTDPYAEVTFRRNGELRKLRFAAPQDLTVSEDFAKPGWPSNVYIADISSKRWDGITVEVGRFEQDAVFGLRAQKVLDVTPKKTV